MSELKQIHPGAPETLYKFRKTSDARVFDRDMRDLFELRRLYMASPKTLNDPADIRPIVLPPSDGRVDQVVEQLLSMNHPIDDPDDLREFVRAYACREGACEEHAEKIYNQIFSACGVLSFSASYKSGAMWAHYASNFEGYVVGYRGRNAGDRNAVPAFPVSYQTERAAIPMFELGTAQAVFAVYSTKSPDWDHEEEWRYVRTRGQGGVGHIDVPEHAITTVILGPRMLATQREIVIERARRLPDRPEILQAFYSRTQFGVEALPLSVE